MQDEERRTWRANWLKALGYFASLRDQRQHWLRKGGEWNPHWTFVEIMCEYFDDLDLTHGYGQKVELGFVTETEAALVHEWHARVEAYEPPNADQYDHQAVLSDPRWVEVCGEAKRVCRSLLSVLSDASEREIALRAGRP